MIFICVTDHVFFLTVPFPYFLFIDSKREIVRGVRKTSVFMLERHTI